MRVGGNIKEIREFEKNLKRSHVAEKLKISTRAYANIENDIADITLNRLEEIANVLGCTPLYILGYKDYKKSFYNSIHNNSGNQGTIKINQSNMGDSLLGIIYDLQKELIESERKRITLLEEVLKQNNIKV
ncbi:helix-turn-helix transcriptional regulator [Sphingobacterium phlebotomi]|uniref:Helix-turn-helix transcriptional regulator n=1 Tax=Sphingobacterium phlebotomi TaxID=2605433 RepID=A0A5D4HA14_9SPHI|nr:helix-turn-helix transcriptional regulator [Sphingobacterium phlebotomi]TYR37444.1 helix-turn-helix transcriptional regulator [Sphingobacterium phlebotomi]